MITKRERAISRHGSVLVEMIFSMGLIVIPGMALQLEIVRSAQNAALMDTAVCEWVRLRALGAAHEAAVRKVSDRWGSYFPTHEAALLKDPDHWWVDSVPGGWEGVLQIRFASFFSHFQTRRQMTRRCFFSSSL